MTKISPMLIGKGGEWLLSRNDYLFEFKFDGIRMLYSNLSSPTLYSRNLVDKTHRYPMLLKELEGLPTGVVLDGEVIAIKNGKQDFYALLSHDHSDSSTDEEIDIFYIIFDILYCNGSSVMNEELTERKQILSAVVADGERVKKAQYYANGFELFEAAKRTEMEGVVAKQKTGRYHAGKRTEDMLKVKCFHRLRANVCAYREVDRPVLCLGIKEEGGGYKYIGNVGCGLTEHQLKDLSKKLSKLKTTKNSFTNFSGDVIYVLPELVADIKYMEFIDGKLRHPVLEGVHS